jgi:hypothetical protein
MQRREQAGVDQETGAGAGLHPVMDRALGRWQGGDRSGGRGQDDPAPATGLWPKPENLQQGYPPIRLRPQQRVRIVDKVIGMAVWLEPQKRHDRLAARHVGPRRPPMGVADSRPAWIRPERVVAVADAEWTPRKRHAVGVMHMNEESMARSPDGYHVRPWLCPGRPGVNHRSVPASHRSLQRVVMVPRTPAGQKPKLLVQVREAIRMRHYSMRTEEAYVSWIKRFILFHGKRHPLEMGEDEMTQFLSALGVRRHVSALTQNQALCAPVFLCSPTGPARLGARLRQSLCAECTAPEVSTGQQCMALAMGVPGITDQLRPAVW